jgi:hypothetical protein
VTLVTNWEFAGPRGAERWPWLSTEGCEVSAVPRMGVSPSNPERATASAIARSVLCRPCTHQDAALVVGGRAAGHREPASPIPEALTLAFVA